MTNKINGIDVSECKYFNKVVNEEPYCNIDEEHLYTCSSDENCYFKQFKRLQKENEGLKSLNDFNVQKIEVLKEENEELKEEKDGMQIVISNYIEHTTKYRQTLEEIRNIAETPIIADKNRFNEITNKINEALNEQK